MEMTIEREKIGVRNRQSARGLRLGLLGLACLSAVSVSASAQTFIEFNAPGAGTGASPATGYSLGTKALSINDDGVITGYYIDASEVYHGFMVSAHGTITTFNAPGAGTTAATGTYPVSINDNGVIVGYYSDPNDVYHGFQLTP